MNEERLLRFFDEQGMPIPFEEIQSQIKETYDAVMATSKQIDEVKITDLFNPECQVDTEAVLDSFSFLDRSLYLCSEITHEHAVSFSDAIRFWNTIDDENEIPEEERQPIKIYIDSPGGDLDATFSIIDSVLLSKTPVWTIVIGSADSGGFFINICGHKRFGYPHSSYLFHEGSCQNEGDAHKYLQAVEHYKKKLSMLKQITLKQTKISEDEYKKHKKDDLWFTAEEALNKGIIDEITDRLI